MPPATFVLSLYLGSLATQQGRKDNTEDYNLKTRISLYRYRISIVTNLHYQRIYKYVIWIHTKVDNFSRNKSTKNLFSYNTINNLSSYENIKILFLTLSEMWSIWITTNIDYISI